MLLAYDDMQELDELAVRISFLSATAPCRGGCLFRGPIMTTLQVILALQDPGGSPSMSNGPGGVCYM